MAYLGPGDIVGSAGGFWGMRAYTAAYATALGNCMDVKTNAGADPIGSPTTIHFTATGEANMTEINAAITAAGASIPLRVSKLYDQSGSSLDLAQGTTSNMPTVNVTPTGFIASRVALSFTGAASSNMATGVVPSHAQPVTLIMFQLRTSTGQATCSVASSPAIGMLGANTAVMYAGTLCSSGSVPDTSTTWNSFGGVFTSPLVFYMNGSSVTLSPTNPGTASPAGGAFTLTNATLDGMIAEAGYWPSDFGGGSNAANLAKYTNTASANPNDGSVTFFLSAGGGTPAFLPPTFTQSPILQVVNKVLSY